MEITPEDKKAISSYSRKRGRVPVTKEQEDLERRRSIREVVFGIQDGVLSTLSFISGMAASGNDPLIGCLMSALGGMLSMGIGEYLGSRAESHVINSVIIEEKIKLENHTEAEFIEHTNFLIAKGFSEDEAKIFTRKLLESPEVWLAEAVREEYGVNINEGQETGAIRNGIVLGLAFFVGDLIPTLAWMFTHNLTWAFTAGAVALAASGYYSGIVSKMNPIRRAIELVFAGGVVFVGTEIIISNLFQ